MQQPVTKGKPDPGWVRMADVARMAGVSMMTVSRAYQQEGRVSPATRARIAEAAAELGYVPNRAAAQLSSRRSRVVAVTIPSLVELQFGNTLQGLSRVLRPAGYQILIAECGSLQEEEERAVATVLGYRPDALVIIGLSHGPASRAMIRGAGIPVIETWNFDTPPIAMSVGFSENLAARRMTEHLIATGRRRIGYVDFRTGDSPSFSERRRGFTEAMQAAGLPDGLVHVVTDAPMRVGSGRKALEALLDRAPEMDALFCSTDTFAIGALLEATRRGCDVPARLAIAGFGDNEMAAEIPPGLTTVRIHPRRIGRVAGEMVLASMVQKQPQKQPQTLRQDLGFDLILRGSA